MTLQDQEANKDQNDSNESQAPVVGEKTKSPEEKYEDMKKATFEERTKRKELQVRLQEMEDQLKGFQTKEQEEEQKKLKAK